MVVAIEADGVLVGSSGVHFGDRKLGPEIGYWSQDPTPGRLGAPRVHLVADVRNLPSQAVARRAGFTQEGVTRSCLPHRDGTRGDAALLSRLPTD